MSRLIIETPSASQSGISAAAAQAQRRLGVRPQDQCPIDFTLSLLEMYLSESCGKCTPCRIGLAQAAQNIKDILDGVAEQSQWEDLHNLAAYITDTADCAIGYESGRLLASCLENFEEDFKSHLETGICSAKRKTQVPCQQACPAHVNVPAYIALIKAGRYVDALRVLRNDNPLTATCGYVCEHPCEMHCRRTIVDDAVNICGLKRYADDHAEPYNPMPALPSTGKTIAIVGGGPAGLTAAYYLQLMGHQVTIIEQRKHLGGMTRYGIPDYRLPQKTLERDIKFILKTGITTKLETSIGKDISYDEILSEYDAIYLAIGAHNDKKLGLEGEDAHGVISAVDFLRNANEHKDMNLKGKRVVVIGGGNVAMDCTRTARRLKTKSVECVYRRRVQDMTALDEEIHDAFAEGCQITELQAPVRIEKDEDGKVSALITQAQMVGEIKRGRPSPVPLHEKETRIECDVIIVAIGQSIDTRAFEHALKVNRGRIVSDYFGRVAEGSNVFAGGDAVSGPATVIKAVAAGKVAARNIDKALGFDHVVYDKVELPAAQPNTKPSGRIEMRNMRSSEAVKTFDLAKFGMKHEEAMQECSRCLRCDHYGFAAQCEGESQEW